MYIRLVGFIEHQDKLLVIKKLKDDGNFRYILPGGHWDFPESFKNGVEREVLEETGLKVVAAKIRKVTLNLKPLRLEFYFNCSLQQEVLAPLSPVIPDLESINQFFEPMFLSKKELNGIEVKTKSARDLIEEFRLS